MGIIMDEEIAKRTPCTCFKIGPTEAPKDLLCFSPGVIGTLTNEQDVTYCSDKLIKTDTKIAERVQRFREASEICEVETAKYPKGEKLVPRLQCMSRELHKRGIEV